MLSQVSSKAASALEDLLCASGAVRFSRSIRRAKEVTLNAVKVSSLWVVRVAQALWLAVSYCPRCLARRRRSLSSRKPPSGPRGATPGHGPAVAWTVR